MNETSKMQKKLKNFKLFCLRTKGAVKWFSSLNYWGRNKTQYYYAIDTARTTMCRRLNELYWNGAVCDFSSVEKTSCASHREG